jgi:hypothetical protein
MPRLEKLRFRRQKRMASEKTRNTLPCVVDVKAVTTDFPRDTAVHRASVKVDKTKALRVSEGEQKRITSAASFAQVLFPVPAGPSIVMII